MKPQLPRVGRTSGEFPSDFGQVNVVSLLESALTDRMLLPMVVFAKADRPAIGRLQTDTAISTNTNVSAFDRHPLTSWDRAIVLSDPRTMSGTASA